MTIHKKIATFKKEFHALKMEMSGKNSHSGFPFFQIQDFIKQAVDLLEKNGLVFKISFPENRCQGTCIDVETGEREDYFCSVADANIPKATPVQNLGGVMTYVRRYMWSLFLDLVEFDGVDATSGAEPEPENKTKTGKKPINTPPLTKTEPPATTETKKEEPKQEAPAKPEPEKNAPDKTALYHIHFMKQLGKSGEVKNALDWIRKEYKKETTALSVTEMKQILAQMQEFLPSVTFEI